MLRPLLFLTAVCGTISTTSTGITSEELPGPTDEESAIIDDVDTNTALVTEVIDSTQKVAATSGSYPDIQEHYEGETIPTYSADHKSEVTAKSTARTTRTTAVKPTTSHAKQLVKPIQQLRVSTNGTNTTLPDSVLFSSNTLANGSSEHIQNITNILHTLVNPRTKNVTTVVAKKQKPQEKQLKHITTHASDHLAVNNVTTELIRIANSTRVATTTDTLGASKVKANDSSDHGSLFVSDSTSSTSLVLTVGSKSTTVSDKSRKHTSPRPSLKVEDTLQASRIDATIDRAQHRRKVINHAALWITIGFVVVLISYIVALVVYNRTRPDWEPSSQEYRRFEDEAPEVSTATTGCTTDDDNVSNHSTDAMTQTHPFLETIGHADREITGYYSDSEQLYRQ